MLEEVFARGASIIATTHFGEIKEYALNTPGFENGCMAFDIKTLRPLYKLQIGNWGNSNAFLIALRLGIDRHIVERAHEVTYGEKASYDGSYDRYIDHMAGQDEHQQLITEQHRQDEYYKQKEKRERSRQYVKPDLKRGDRVCISNMEHTGIVCEEENSRGEVVVMVRGKKYSINQKRLTLHIDREDLYPEDYDMDILFETKENRKKRKIMGKHHVEGLVIEQNKERDD